MSAGIPVIASDLPVVRELGEHGRHIYLVKPGSVDQIAQAVLDLHEDRTLWRKLAEGGRARVLERHTWEASCATLAEVYEELGIPWGGRPHPRRPPRARMRAQIG
jgi:glycosyltransferase involved in cell wall biosynthesis